MNTPAIDKAIEIVGSQAELARRLKVTSAYVNKMFRTKVVPPQRCRQIEHETSGEVTAEMLRPDIFGKGAALPIDANPTHAAAVR